MSRPIELGLVLEGQDAIDFEEYLKNPTTTPEGRALLDEAYRRFQMTKVIKQLHPLLRELANLCKDCEKENYKTEKLDAILEFQYFLDKIGRF